MGRYIIDAKNNCLAVLILTLIENLTTAYINPEDKSIFKNKYDIPTTLLKYRENVILIKMNVKKTTCTRVCI